MAKQKSEVGSRKSESERPLGPTGPVGPPGDYAEGMVEIEVPADLVEAMGGAPIPPPPFRMPRPEVTRVGEGKPARKFADAGGLLASPRPGRRDAIAKIQKAREAIAALVRQLDEAVPALGTKIAAASADSETCEVEGFDPVRANALVEDLAALLAKHFGE